MNQQNTEKEKITHSARVVSIDIDGVIGVPEQEQFGSLDGRVATYQRFEEALEEVRAGNRIRPGDPTPAVYYSGGGYNATAPTKCCKKPEGYAIELADAVIRIADLCGYMGIDLEAAIREKMAYNATRPHKHGKNF